LATARTLAKHPQVNINVGDKQVLQYADINLAIAVSIDDGLIAPVIKKADALSLSQISKEAKRLISGAREGKLSLPEYGHGTFTVSNLGMHGIKRFTSIINPPQAAILSVGQFHRAPIETLDGFDFRWKLSLTMACDHRVIDGTTGTSMLESLKALLEAPKPLFD
jgi:pyruvate dehydrogenase E2 component (dihydrolipoamide acetyltransferase)